ncbi:MAG: molybdopterin adenylyltransferase, partial [Planctomycetaceae bacterium]
MSAPIRIGIVTVSDRASQGVYTDRGGPAIRDWLAAALNCPWQDVPRIIPDEQPVIEQTLRELCDVEQCCLVVTTGGTGPALRDVTPEATENVCEKLLPGFGEAMRAVSLTKVPTAI